MKDLIVEHFQLRRHPFSVEIEADGLYPFKSFQQGMLGWSRPPTPVARCW